MSRIKKVVGAGGYSFFLKESGRLYCSKVHPHSAYLLPKPPRLEAYLLSQIPRLDSIACYSPGEGTDSLLYAINKSNKKIEVYQFNYDTFGGYDKARFEPLAQLSNVQQIVFSPARQTKKDLIYILANGDLYAALTNYPFSLRRIMGGYRWFEICGIGMSEVYVKKANSDVIYRIHYDWLDPYAYKLSICNQYKKIISGNGHTYIITKNNELYKKDISNDKLLSVSKEGDKFVNAIVTGHYLAAITHGRRITLISHGNLQCSNFYLTNVPGKGVMFVVFPAHQNRFFLAVSSGYLLEAWIDDKLPNLLCTAFVVGIDVFKDSDKAMLFPQRRAYRGRSRLELALKGFKGRIYKLFIDYDRYENRGINERLIYNPRFLFNKPNDPYHNNMMEAFRTLNSYMQSGGRRRFSEMYEQLHIDALKEEMKLTPVKIGNYEQRYGFNISCATEEAKQELLIEKIILDPQGLLKETVVPAESKISELRVVAHPIAVLTTDTATKGGLRQVGMRPTFAHCNSGYYSESREEIMRRVDLLFGNYFQKLMSTQWPSEDRRLELIARLCRALEMSHFFADGNQRTVVFLVLNALLLENGFPLCIIPNPYVFNGYCSARELVELIRIGIAIFHLENGENRMAIEQFKKAVSRHSGKWEMAFKSISRKGLNKLENALMSLHGQFRDVPDLIEAINAAKKITPWNENSLKL